MQHYTREKRGIKVLNLIFFLIMIVLNGLANTTLIGGVSTEVISDRYKNLFTPAGITFAVWGVIYLALGYFVIFQLGKSSYGSKKKEALEKIGPLFIISCILNGSWLIAWGYDLIPLSLGIMFLLLITLYAIYFKVHSMKDYLYNDEKRAFIIPFSLYTAWITVAIIANLAAYFKYIEWGGFGLSETFWIIFSIILATLVNLLFIYGKSDFFFGLVGVWALSGIALGRYEEGNIFPVGYVAAAGAVVILISILLNIIRNRKSN